MSESARRIPGQSIFERLMGRVYSRPAVGVSSSFYERFGLTDPWLDEAVVATQEDEGFFTFLSAAPYYARLRALRQRAWWGRRRLLQRLAEASNGPLVARPLEWLVRGSAAMSGASGTSGWLRTSSMASSISSQIDSAVVMLGTPPEQPVAPSVARVADRPMDRALGRRGRRTRGVMEDVVEDVLVTVPRRVRRLVRQIADDASFLPIEEQVVVARRLARSVRSPLARLIEPETRDVAVEADQRPVAVAMARGAAEPQKGLRPVMSRSPALQTLVFEASEERAEAVAAPPARRRRLARDVQPASVDRPSAHRETPVAAVAREVRTQRVTGRAGPLQVVRAPRAPEVALATPTRPPRRPTTWVAELAVGTEATTEPSDARYGLRAVRRASRRAAIAPAAVERVVARSVVPASSGSLGETLLSASPVARFDRPARRVRRRIVLPDGTPARVVTHAIERVAARFDTGRRNLATVLSAPTAYVTPVAPEAPAEGAAVTPRRRRAVGAAPVVERRETDVVAPVGAPARRPTRRPVVGVTPSHPEALRPEALPSEVPPRRRAAPLRDVAELTSPTVRAVARAAEPTRVPTTRRLVPAAMAHVLVEPVAEVTPAPAAQAASPARRALARAGSEPSPARRRVAIARVPTAYVGEAPEVEAAAPAAPPRRRAASRAVARAEVAQRVDRRGRALLSASPVDYLATPEDSAAPLAAAPSRRRVPTAPDAVTLTAPEPAVASEAPVSTARLARRVSAPASEATPRAIVREGREVVPARVVRTGSTHYAAARLELARDEASPAEPTSRLAASSRRHARRPMPHVPAWNDFRLLLPEVPTTPEVAPAVRGPMAAAAPTARRVARALRRVTAAVHAAERSELTPVVVPAARRTLRRAIAGVAPAPERVAGARIEARSAPRPDARGVFRRPLAVDSPVLLEIALEATPAVETAVERVERRVEPTVVRPSNAPIERAVQGTTSARKGAPVAHAASRSTWTRERPLRAAAETVRTADGRYERSPSRVPARFVEAPEEDTSAFALGSPALRRSRRPAPALVSLEPQDLEPEDTTAAPGTPARRRRAPMAAATPERRRREDQAPSWAHRAATGASTAVPVAGRAPLPRTGTILGSLARASTPEDVVRVLIEGDDVVKQAARELPQPAVRLIERIVEVQQDAERAAAVRGPEAELLSPRRGHQVREGHPVQQNLYTLRPMRSSPSRGVDGVGASRVMKLANKLLQLIHLAEADKRKAQRQVRMAEEGSQIMRASTETGEGGAGGEQGAPNISALKREVVEAVYRELQLLGMRRQEAMNDGWW